MDTHKANGSAVSAAMAEAPGAPRVGRRGFFGLSLGMAAAGVAAGGALPAAAEELGDARTKARYQADSAHVQKYYTVNRLVWPEGK